MELHQNGNGIPIAIDPELQPGAHREEEGEKPQERQELGEIRVANEVVGIIAGLAATEIEGIAGMSGGIGGGIAEMLGRKSLLKGVKVEVDESRASVDLYVVVNFGVRIPEVAWKVQENVKRAIEGMTGLQVVEVNIHVQGVHFPEPPAAEESDSDSPRRSK